MKMGNFNSWQEKPKKRLSTASMQDVLAGKKIFANAGGDCCCTGSGGDGSGSCSSCGSCGSNTH